MGLHAINRSTRTRRGGGLPFYDKKDYIFSAINGDFNSTVGLWEVPLDRTPSFQLIIPFYDTLQTFQYLETKGCNDFTGVTVNQGANLVNPITVTPIKIDGVQNYVYSLSDSPYIVQQAISGRWIILMIVKNFAGGQEAQFLSEEFVIKECCG